MGGWNPWGLLMVVAAGWSSCWGISSTTWQSCCCVDLDVLSAPADSLSSCYAITLPALPNVHSSVRYRWMICCSGSRRRCSTRVTSEQRQQFFTPNTESFSPERRRLAMGAI